MCVCVYVYVYTHIYSLVTKSYPILATPWTVAHQAPLCMEFLRQEYWNGLPFPSPGDLPRPGIELTSPVLAGGFFTTELQGKSWHGAAFTKYKMNTLLSSP